MQCAIFAEITDFDLQNAVENLPSNKAPILHDIPVSISRNFASCYCDKLRDILTGHRVSEGHEICLN